MNKVFHDADHKFLNYVLFYGHTDNKLYHDKAHKQAVTKAEMDLVANDRMLIEVSGVRYAPVSVKISTQDEVVVITNSGSVAAATYSTK